MKKVNAILVALFLIGLPLAAGAMEGMQHGEHGKMGETKHEGMMMGKGMVMLGDQTVEGVKAMAHLNDVKEAMAKMGMKETHHFMVAFVDAAGNPITEGTVAVKIEDPAEDRRTDQTMGMEGHFCADIVLAEKGEYT
jgi:hypothetical protein